MYRPLAKPEFQSSFLSIEKDTETILRKIFIESRPHSDKLKSLLAVNGNDCLSNIDNPVYQKVIRQASLPWLKQNDFVIMEPKINFDEFDEKKSFLIFTYDNFTPNYNNPEFRDCLIMIDIISHIDLWDLGDYQQRPVKIMGFIDGILNNCRLSGIGKLEFAGAQRVTWSKHFSGYTLVYRAVHGSDDEIPAREEE